MNEWKNQRMNGWINEWSTFRMAQDLLHKYTQLIWEINTIIGGKLMQSCIPDPPTDCRLSHYTNTHTRAHAHTHGQDNTNSVKY